MYGPPLILATLSAHTTALTTAIPLFTFLSLSRLGLWTFDLTTTETTQLLVPASTRSSFGGTEQSLVAFFELLQWVAAAVWSRPDQFPWLALGSLGAVAVSAGMYASWVRGKRGHLVHLDVVCGK